MRLSFKAIIQITIFLFLIWLYCGCNPVRCRKVENMFNTFKSKVIFNNIKTKVEFILHENFTIIEIHGFRYVNICITPSKKDLEDSEILIYTGAYENLNVSIDGWIYVFEPLKTQGVLQLQHKIAKYIIEFLKKDLTEDMFLSRVEAFKLLEYSEKHQKILLDLYLPEFICRMRKNCQTSIETGKYIIDKETIAIYNYFKTVEETEQ